MRPKTLGGEKKVNFSDKVGVVEKKKIINARKIHTRSQNQSECLPLDPVTDSKHLKKKCRASIKLENKNFRQLENKTNVVDIAAKTKAKKADIVMAGIKSEARNPKLCDEANEIQSSITVDTKINADKVTLPDQVQSEATTNGSEGGARPSTSSSRPTSQPLPNTSEFQHGYFIEKISSQEQKIKLLEAEVASLQNQLRNFNRGNDMINQHGRQLSEGPQWYQPPSCMQSGTLVGPAVAHPVIEFLPQQTPLHTPVPYPYRQVNRVFEPFSPYSFGSTGYPLMARYENQLFSLPFNTNF